MEINYTTELIGVALASLIIGFVIGTKLSKHAIERLVGEKKHLADIGISLNKSLKVCRERSTERKEEIDRLNDLLIKYKEDDVKHRKELYAYRERYGELD